ncbi:MAG: thiazole synthase [Candidatus Hydrogenedentota bacterium]
MIDDNLIIAGCKLSSRLFIGTGKFASGSVMKETLEAVNPGFVTVALRRVNFKDTSDPILSYIDTSKFRVVPNTSGATTSSEAIRIAHLCREIGGFNWIKLEIHPDNYHLMPDPVETLQASIELVKDGFVVLPYIHADPVLAKRLEEAGCACVMPLGSPIGTNKGIQTEDFIKIIIERSNVPVIIDAGIGRPSDAMRCMELGSSGVLVNTAIATSHDPVGLAKAFNQAVDAGRLAYLSGLPKKHDLASPTSPLTDFLEIPHS